MRHWRWSHWIAAAVLVCGTASAQPLGTPAAPHAALTQRLDAALPLELPLVASDGRAVQLGDYFRDSRPVLLVLGYFRCVQLCGLLMHGLLESLHESAVPRRDVRIVDVSIDPQDTPATARARRDAYLAYADFLQGARSAGAPLDLHLLTAKPRDIARLAREVGFAYERVAEAPGGTDGGTPALFAHPAGVIVVTPQGRISRYLMGIRFDPGEVRRALVEASHGRIGTLSDRVALLCAHLDLALGRHSVAVMNAARIISLLLVAALGTWCWRRRGTRPEQAS